MLVLGGVAFKVTPDAWSRQDIRKLDRDFEKTRGWISWKFTPSSRKEPYLRGRNPSIPTRMSKEVSKWLGSMGYNVYL